MRHISSVRFRGDADTELYYWIRGSAGITGKVYGSVDFKIISIDVSIEITAMATLEMTAYKATLVELSLSVRVSFLLLKKSRSSSDMARS